MNKPLIVGGFKLESQRLTRKVQAAPPALDIMVYVAGWETRAAHVGQLLKISAPNNVGLRFESTSSIIEPRKDASEAAMSKLRPRIEVLRLGRTAEYHSNCMKLEPWFLERYRRKGAPLSVGLDITCLPKMYVAYLVALLFKRGICCRLEAYYSEGKYVQIGPGSKQKVNGFSFSTGDWDTVGVPYIEASIMSDHNRNLIMSVGAEIRQAKAFLSRFEPNQLAVIGVENKVDRLDLTKVADAKGMHAMFKSVKGGGGFAEFYELGDIAGVVTAANSVLQGWASERVTVFAVGCKPHTLAMTVLALSNQNVELICRKPGAYSNYDATALGPIHRFQLVDRFEPLGYLKN